MAVQGRRWFIIAMLVMIGLSASSGLGWLVHAAAPTAAEPATQALVASLAPVIPAASGDQCVADTDLMRSDHMAFLNHQRDETVIEGKRDNPFSLIGCVNCHAQTTADGMPIRIDAEGQFCESCHRYAAVKIDCFSCHAAVPEQDKMIGLHDTAASMLAEIQPHSMVPVSLRNPLGPAESGKYHGKSNALVTAD